jgi:fructose-1,6-bisphosphatase I
MEKNQPTLGKFISEHQKDFKYSSVELSKLISSTRLAAKIINYQVNKAGLLDILGAAGDKNIQGEDQGKLDVYVNDVFKWVLTNRQIVCEIAGEEDFITIET